MTLFSRFRDLMLDKKTYETLELVKESYASVEDAKYIPILSEQVVNVGNTEDNNGCILGSDVYRDLEFFNSYGDEDVKNEEIRSHQGSVYQSIKGWSLMGSNNVANKLLTAPSCDVNILRVRQSHVKRLSKIEDPVALKKQLDILKDSEKHFLWLFESTDTNLDSIYELVYFSGYILKYLNQSPHVLTGYNIYRMIWSPLIGIVSPIVYFVVPYLILRLKFGIRTSFVDYLKLMFTTVFSTDMLTSQASPFLSKLSFISYALSLLFYFQNTFTSVEIAKATYSLSKIIVTHVNGIIHFVKNAHDIVSTYWSEEIASAFSLAISPLPNMTPSMYFANIVPTDFSIFSNFGNQLSIFKCIKKEAFLPMINRLYILDVLFSVGKTVSAKYSAWCYPDYIENAEKPSLDVQDFYHPCLTMDAVVKNNISLSNNMIITGPNAGGKSTVIKSIMISVLLAQTLGISNGSRCSFTPFYFINTQINIPDCKGKRSLFEAEMYRAKENIDALANMPKHQHALIAIDEIFSSTNPIEGISGGYAIAKRLAQHTNAISIISTHFIYLTRLASEKNSTFMRYKMNVNVDQDGHVVSYPYKLVKGISRQYIALELLKRNGFDEEIIQEAISIKKRLTEKPHKDE